MKDLIEGQKKPEVFARANSLDANNNGKLDREELEAIAIDEVCACRYYDLQDTLQETPDEDLLLIINHAIPCEICGQ